MIINESQSFLLTQAKQKSLSVEKSQANKAAKSIIDSKENSASSVSISKRARLYGLKMSVNNTQDAASMLQTIDIYLNETQNILYRIRTLAINSIHGSYSSDDRQLFQVEVSQLIDEVDRVASQAQFNRIKLLTGAYSKMNPTASMWFQTGAKQTDRERFYIQTMTASALRLKDPIDQKIISVWKPEKDDGVVELVDSALLKVIRQRKDISSYVTRLEKINAKIIQDIDTILDSQTIVTDVKSAGKMVEKIKIQIGDAR